MINPLTEQESQRAAELAGDDGMVCFARKNRLGGVLIADLKSSNPADVAILLASIRAAVDGAIEIYAEANPSLPIRDIVDGFVQGLRNVPPGYAQVRTSAPEQKGGGR